MNHRTIGISQIYNDCNLDLCVDTQRGETLSSILAKICEANPSGGEGGCCYTFENSSTIVWTVDGNTVSAASIGVSELDSGDLAPLFTTDVSTPTSTPYLSFTLNTQSPLKVFASPTSGVGYPSFRSLVFDDMPFDVGDFIQNQLPTDQVANWRISGSGRVGTYLQVSDASRIVKDITGTLAITQDTSSTIGDHLRVRHLKFFDDTAPGTAGACTSEIYATQGDDIVIYTPGAYGALKLDSPFVRIGNGISKPILAPGGFHPLTIYGSDAEVGNYDYLELYNANEAGLSAESLKTRLTFASNRENGTPIVDIGLPGGNQGDKQRFGAFGIEVISTDEASYKADFLWETVDGAVNTGLPTEQLRLTYDGKIIASAYSTLLAAPTPNGLKHMLTCDEDGLFSHEAIPAGGVGSVSSVGLQMPSAFSVANSPITNSGTFVVTGAGTTSQYIRGDGSLATFGVPLSSLLPAVAFNTIDNNNFGQIWLFSGLTHYGILMAANTTASANQQAFLPVSRIGNHASSNIESITGSFQNSHSGTGAKNIALKGFSSLSTGTSVGGQFFASGGASNWALELGNASGTSNTIRMNGSTSGAVNIQTAAAAGSYTLTLPTNDGNSGQVLTTDGSGILSWGDNSLKTPISGLLAATATNSIDSGNYFQEWKWNSLQAGSGGAGLGLTSNSTLLTGGETLIYVNIYGANTPSGITTTSATFTNNRTGTTSTNIAAQFSAASGTNNYAAKFLRGAVSLGTVGTEGGRLQFNGSLTGTVTMRVAANAGTYNFTLPSTVGNTNDVLQTDGTGNAFWGPILGTTPTLQQVITAGNQLNVNNTIDVNGTNLIFENCTNFVVEGAGAYVNVPLLAVNPAGDVGIGDYLYLNDGIGISINPIFGPTGMTLRSPGPNGMFFQFGGYGSANNGDVLVLLDNSNGSVGWASPGGAPGSVTNFSSGNLSPLFTTSVATSTSTPALTFALTNAGAHTYFGNNTGGSAAPAYKSNAALTKTDDTNVTLTLGGSPTTSLLEAASITVGWTGSLAVGRGGTGITSYTIGDTVYASGSTTLSKLPIGTTGQILRVNAGATAPEWYTQTFNSGTVTSFSAGDLSPLFTTTESTATTTPALAFVLTNAGANTYFGNAGALGAPSYTSAGALTTVSDTNIVLTVGGNAATSLLRAASVTATWNGTLGVARGGTNLASYAIGDIIYASGATTLAKLAIGAPGQQLRVNGGGTALEYFTAGPGITTLNTLTAATQLFDVGITGTDFNISSSVDTHTFNIPSASAAARGLVTTAAQTFAGLKTFNAAIIVNELAADSDFRVETVGNANAIFVDASTNRVGFFNATPTVPVDIVGNTLITGSLGLNAAPSTAAPLVIGGSGWTSSGLIMLPSISAAAGSSASILGITGTIIEAATSTHTILSAVNISAPTITPGLATVTNAATLFIGGGTSAVVTGGNYAILVAGGTFRANGDWIMGTSNAYTTGGYSLLVYNQTSGRLETVEPDVLSFSSQAASGYTLVLADRGKMVQRSNGSAQTLTIPTNASIAFPVGTTILIEQTGAGQITFIPTGGVTMNSADGATKTRVQWVVASLIKTATNTWTLTGDIVV